MSDPELIVQSMCGAEYERAGGRERGDRIVRCDASPDHKGDHVEGDTGYTWPRPMPTTPIEPVFTPAEPPAEPPEDDQAHLAQYKPIRWIPSPSLPGEPWYGWEWAHVTTPRADGSQGQTVLLARCPWCRRTGTANVRASLDGPDYGQAVLAWTQNELVRKHFCYAMPAVVLDWR